jgi:two-component system response regulator HydG
MTPHDPRPNDDALWSWLADTAADPAQDTCALALARLLASLSRAERVFLALTTAGGDVIRAWGADLDGLPISDADRRLPAPLVAAALQSDGPIYHRDTRTSGGAGSRLGAAGPVADPRAVLVFEHRFATACFDALASEDIARWATLAAIVGRLRAEPDARARARSEDARSALLSSASFPAEPAESSTSVPLKAARRAFPTILGASPALARALARLDAAIDSDLPVLITGETGTGKELFARALHDMGSRAGGPFVPVNCAAIPDTLFEAEFFGHARGSFTGAERARPGLLARAEGGTILLDEVGELPLARQATLLRALESRRYRPVGSDEEKTFDVRIVAATNRRLDDAVRRGTFRRDLVFRLKVLELHIPPLRDRAGDVAFLAASFLERTGSSSVLSPRAIDALSAYEWPGNVRELEHHMQRLAALRIARIDLEHLPRSIRARASEAALKGRAPRSAEPDALDAPRAEGQRALAQTGGNISHAATLLGLTRHGLKKRMLRLGMRAPTSSGKV